MLVGMDASNAEAEIRNESGAVICARCRVARTPVARLRGLLGRRQLGDDEGLLLVRCRAVHTALMRFPVEAVFLSGDGEVLRVERLAPWRAASHRGARSVLELAPGGCARAGVRVGDMLRHPAPR